MDRINAKVRRSASTCEEKLVALALTATLPDGLNRQAYLDGCIRAAAHRLFKTLGLALIDVQQPVKATCLALGKP